jgi:hypothetical protein
MKINLRISKIINILLLTSFLLPFYPTACGTSKAQKAEIAKQDSIAIAAKEQAILDSIAALENMKADSIVSSKAEIIRTSKDSICNTSKVDSTNNIKSLTTTDKLKGNKLIYNILRPNNHYSGIGYIIDLFFQYVGYCGTMTAFLLIIISLMLKTSYQLNKFIVINFMNIISLILMYFTQNFGDIADEKLWGFWICFFLMISQTITDLGVTIKNKNSH